MSFKTVMLAGALTLAGVGAASAAYVTADLNVRSGPGTGYGVITTVPAGAPVAVLGCDGAWCRVSAGGVRGFASASYIAGGGAAYAAAPPPVYVAPPVVRYGYGPGWRHRHWYQRHHRWHR